MISHREMAAACPLTGLADRSWIGCSCRKANNTATGTVLRMTPADSEYKMLGYASLTTLRCRGAGSVGRKTIELAKKAWPWRC